MRVHRTPLCNKLIYLCAAVLLTSCASNSIDINKAKEIGSVPVVDTYSPHQKQLDAAELSWAIIESYTSEPGSSDKPYQPLVAHTI